MRRLTHRWRSGVLTPQDAQALQLLQDALNGLKFTASPPLTVSQDSSAVRYGLQPQAPGLPGSFTGFWARISTAAGGTNGYSYGFIEQYQAIDGTPSDMPGGRIGSQTVLPAVPVDKSKTVPLNSIVQLFLSEKQACYNFLLGGGGSGSFTDDPAITITYVTDVQCTGGTLAVTKTSRVVEGRLSFSVFVSGNPSGGSFGMLANNNPITVQWNATAQSLQNQLAGFFPLDVVLVTGGPFPGGFMNVFLKTGSTLTIAQNNLTGGTNPIASISGPS